MIIAVDYDGTLEYCGAMNDALIRKLSAAQRSGNIIILWTCRSGKRLAEALSMLRSSGLAPNFVNENCPSAISMLRANPRKIYADIYIDDKNGVI